MVAIEQLCCARFEGVASTVIDNARRNDMASQG